MVPWERAAAAAAAEQEQTQAAQAAMAEGRAAAARAHLALESGRQEWEAREQRHLTGPHRAAPEIPCVCGPSV